jgi:hypothetical protein
MDGPFTGNMVQIFCSEAANEIEALRRRNRRWRTIATNLYMKRDGSEKQYEKEVRSGNR